MLQFSAITVCFSSCQMCDWVPKWNVFATGACNTVQAWGPPCSPSVTSLCPKSPEPARETRFQFRHWHTKLAAVVFTRATSSKDGLIKAAFSLYRFGNMYFRINSILGFQNWKLIFIICTNKSWLVRLFRTKRQCTVYKINFLMDTIVHVWNNLGVWKSLFLGNKYWNLPKKLLTSKLFE